MKSVFRTSFFIFTLLALTVNALGFVTTAQAAPIETEPGVGASSLMQFTSSGHILGFTSQGMYAATGSHALHVDFVNANNAQPQSASATSKDGKAVPLSQVTYANLWDGVTLAYNASGIYTTTYTVAPHADARNIKLKYNVPLTLNKDGSLSLAFESGALTESAPIAWQSINGKRVAVDAAYQIRGQEVAFKLGAYNPSYVLMIDPTLTWNTFLGGSRNDYAASIAVDGSGNAYVAGNSRGTWGAPVRAYSDNGSSTDAFAAKLNSSGVLQWNTFLGGGADDGGSSIAIDGNGNVYVAGDSSTTWGVPVRAHSYICCAGRSDAFAAQLNSSGVLQWNTFLGGSGGDGGSSIAVDGSGNVYVTGSSDKTWGAPVRAYSTAGNNENDAFAAKLNSSGVLQWNTFLGGIWNDWGYSIAVDGSGNVYVVGQSTATWGAPVRAFNAGNSDAFAVQLNSSGVLQWNTFLGGSEYEIGYSIAVDGNGNVYVAGDSEGTWGAPVRAFGDGVSDTFAAQLNSSGVLQWNTFLGGSGYDTSASIAVNGSGNVYVAGRSGATWGAPARAYSAGYNAYDAFAAQLNSSGVLQWNTFLGGSGYEASSSIAVDGSGNVYVTGIGEATWGAPVRAYSAGLDAFVALIAPSAIQTQRLLNGGFNLYGTTKIPKSWKAANFSSTDGKSTTKKEGKYAVKIAGASGKTKTLTETLTLSGIAGDSFTFSYWAKGALLPKAGLCQAQVILYSGSTKKLTKTLPCGTLTSTFKKKTLTFASTSAYDKVLIKFTYSKASGTVWFDLASLIR